MLCSEQLDQVNIIYIQKVYQTKAITSVSVTYTARFRFYSTNATVGDHTGLEAPVGCSESPKNVHNVGINCGVVEMVPVHHHLHKVGVFILLHVTVLDIKASVVVSCIAVSWVACVILIQ